jgi:NADPH-dependent ferric siderophore reductase
VPVTVLLDLADPANAGYLDEVPGADRARILPVSRALEDGLLEAVRALGPIGPATVAFLAGEATRLVSLRRYLRRELELPPEQVIASGYWKRGVVALDHHAPIDPADPD